MKYLHKIFLNSIKTVGLWIVFLNLISLGLYSQQIYSGLYGKYKHKYTLLLNNDSSVILTKTINEYGYSEYNANIKRLNDTLFTITTNDSFHQEICRAIGDSMVYISIDSTIRNSIKNVTLIYSNNQTFLYPITGETIKILINKKLLQAGSGNNFFYVTIGHINPLTHQKIKTRFEMGDEYGLELYKAKNTSFNVIIKNNRIKKIGKGGIDNFVLIRQSAPAK